MSLCPHKDAGEFCRWHNPEPEPEITKGGLVYRADGESCRVTSIAGRWGYWVNGTHTEPFDTREEAARAFIKAGSNPLN